MLMSARHYAFIIRALCSIGIGVLLIDKPEQMTTLLVQLIGSLFLLSGVVPLLAYLFPRAEAMHTALRPVFPVVGIGSILLGLLLLFKAEVFVTALMYLLGALLVLAGVHQMILLQHYRRVAPARASYYVYPLLLLGLGLFILFFPMKSASLPFLLLGIGCLYYGIMDLIYGIRILRYVRRQSSEYVDFEEEHSDREIEEK